MPVPGKPSGGTRPQQITYYAGIIQQDYPGIYEGNQTVFYGMTFSQLYTTLANENPQDTPEDLAGVVVEVAAAQKLGTGIQAAGEELGKFSAAAEKALSKTNFNTTGIPNSALNSLSGIEAIGQFFNDLRDPSFWIRAGKIVAGSLILIIGLLKLTGAAEKAGPIAAKAVKAAPFL